MTRKEAIEKRAQELMDQGRDPEDAFAVAVIEQSIKEQEEADAEAKKSKELDTVIAEGKKVVADLENVHRELTED